MKIMRKTIFVCYIEADFEVYKHFSEADFEVYKHFLFVFRNRFVLLHHHQGFTRIYRLK